MVRPGSAWLFLLFFASVAGQGGTVGDVDGDGLDDGFEQALLDKFVPEFQVSVSDCDFLPAEFAPGSAHPVVRTKNGLIYGRVSRWTGGGGAHLELQYYHLWSRDCGRFSHSLDVEHVSALIRAEGADVPAAGWTALFWYAGAHEGTVCDSSQIVRASEVHAEASGPTIWISDAKHASYLSRDLCRKGCGGDRCEAMTPLAPPRILNLGEAGAPMNGASWTASPRWGIASKLKSDFAPGMVSRLEAPGVDGILLLNPSPAKPVISAGNKTVEGVAMGNRKAEIGLAIADRHTERSVNGACAKVERSLKRSRDSVGRFLRRGKKPGATRDAGKR